MKKEKYFFNLLTKDVPETDWEADYIVEDNKILTTYITSLFGIGSAFLISAILLVFLNNSIQCSVNIELEGKGDIVLNETELSSTFEKFQFEEGKIKLEASVPCSFVKDFNEDGGN